MTVIAVIVALAFVACVILCSALIVSGDSENPNDKEDF